MKKVFCFLLVAVLLCGAYGISAFADGGTLIVTDAAKTVEPGEDFTMDVVIADNPGFAAMILDLDYDHSALQLTGAAGVIGVGSWEINDVCQNDVIVWYDGINITINGPIVRLYFKVRENTPAGEYYVSIKRPVDDWRGIFNESDNCPLSFNYVSGKVVVGPPTVLGVWYYNAIEGQPAEIHVTTSLNSQYLYLCLGDKVLETWNADEANIDVNDFNKEWHVSHVFEYPGTYYVSYKASPDGVSTSPANYKYPVVIGRPPVLDWWYDKGFENIPVAAHVYTNRDMQYLYVYLGDELIDTWTLDREDITTNDTDLWREWVGYLTFEYPGDYQLWYKASADGVNISNAYSAGAALTVERPGVIDYWYEDGVENTPMQLHITTNLDAQYLYMYLGDDLLQTWTADEADITVYEEQLCKDWNVSYTFEYPGDYNLWYKSSADGKEMSLAYGDLTKPAKVARPQIIELSYGDAVVGQPMEISITTNKDVQKVNMYLDEDQLASWAREDASVEEFESCDVWTVSYTFEEAGEKALWYKASNDGTTEGNAFPFEPVVVEQ